jgi:cephalosporin-C deacetylase-like acetyl esterase
MRSALILAACAVLRAQAPLDVTSGLDGMVDRYLTGIANQQLADRAARIGGIHTASDVAARQAYIREKMVQEIGGFPGKSPLQPRITGTLDRGDYKIEKLIFQSRPHDYVTADVYVPANGHAPYPAVLGVAGHSADGKAYESYQRVWVSLAKRGFLVLAYDPPGQGERLEHLDASGKSLYSAGGTGEHIADGLQCLLTGSNVAAYEIWDGIRAFDYLLTRPDVDPKRIAVAGNSGGGTQSSYLAAFEPRLAAAAPSCYLTSWSKLWAGPGPQDSEQVFPDFLRDGLDFADFLVAFAPKPIQMATATRDFFPIEGARATYAEARKVFQILDADVHLGFFEYDDTHGWSKPRREATYRWLARWMQGREDAGTEPDFKLDTPEDLRVTETGQVATSIPDAETVQSLNASVAEQLYARRPGAGGRHIPALVRDRLRLGARREAAHATSRGTTPREGYAVEKIELETEPGITVPALAFVPSAGPVRKPAVIYLNPNGKAVAAQPGGLVDAMMHEGRIVLAIDVRGWGESAIPAKKGGYSPLYQTAMRALLVGKSMPGMQTTDVLSAFDYLAGRRDVVPAHITVYGTGQGGILAMLAAAVEPRIEMVTAVNAPESYMAVVRMKTYPTDEVVDSVIPGVLRDFDLPDVRRALGPRLNLQP